MPPAAGHCYSQRMKTLLAMTLALCATPLAAETLLVDDQVQIKPAAVELPARGSSMAAVEARFGAPRAKHAAVGKPPITRWDFDGYSVYFEYQHVVHAVAHGG
jgi:hypothetical protein